MQPEEFWWEPSAVIALTLQVGHGAAAQLSTISRRRIRRFEVIGPDGATMDLRAQLRSIKESPDCELNLRGSGTYVLALETDNSAQSHLPAGRFNDYIRDEGLLPALHERVRKAEMHMDGLERYGRRAKAIVQVGQPDAHSQPHVTAPLGLSLEIVPEVNPYTEPRPASFPVRIIYEGQPLAGALVKLVDLQRDMEPRESQLTDSAGRAAFMMPQGGIWLLIVAWTKPLSLRNGVDFETVFSSLAFGFPDTP